MTPEDIMGASEICELAGVSKQTLRKWRLERGFPKPIVELACGPLWHADHVRLWLDAWRSAA